jgi:hypothetical protein
MVDQTAGSQVEEVASSARDQPEGRPGQVEIDEGALVLRFKPISEEALWRSACKTHRYNGRYQLSVFADVPGPSESDEELVKRLLEAAGRQGINLSNNPKYFLCAPAAKLLDQGFTFWKDGGEVNEHYSVDLGIDATVSDAGRFGAAFDRDGRR